MTFAMGGILHAGSRHFGPVLCLLLGPPDLHDHCGPNPDEEAGHQCDTAITNHSHKEFLCDWDVGRLRPGTLSMAERCYPTSEVRGSGQECQAAMVQEQQRGAVQVRGQGWWPGGATPRPRPGKAGRGATRGAVAAQA